mmetsp:Transcript_1492/g.4052  ORF Transcript_1492/g.4052 Transcript_1492/m.4052 type:complete len:211 (+) Transcript_1492:1165-1797(+)
MIGKSRIFVFVIIPSIGLVCFCCCRLICFQLLFQGLDKGLYNQFFRHDLGNDLPGRIALGREFQFRWSSSFINIIVILVAAEIRSVILILVNRSGCGGFHKESNAPVRAALEVRLFAQKLHVDAAVAGGQVLQGLNRQDGGKGKGLAKVRHGRLCHSIVVAAAFVVAIAIALRGEANLEQGFFGVVIVMRNLFGIIVVTISSTATATGCQ